MINAFRDLPLRQKLTLGILVASVVPLLLAAALVWGYQMSSLRALAMHDLDVKAEVFAAALSAAVEFKDLPTAQEVLTTQRQRREMVAVGLYDRTGGIFASYHRAGSDALPPLRTGHMEKPRPVGDDLEIIHAIYNGPELVGYLYMRTDLAAYYVRLPAQGAIVFGVLVGLLGLAWWLSREFQRMISQPILSLAKTVREVGERKDFTVRAVPSGRDEIGTLTEGFNEMLSGIQMRDAALQATNDALSVENAARRQAEESLHTLNVSLEHRVQERTVELQAANRELESFSYSVSHDLRAPLRHIHSYVEMLTATLGKELPEQPRRLLQIITHSAEEMGRLIDALLDFSRMGRAELSEGRVPLEALVQEVWRGLEPEVRGRNLQWQHAPLPPVRGDATMLKQVLANLLGNAVKYTRGRDPARIELGLAGEEEGRTVFFVRDNGAGFDMRYAGKLFGVFQRLHRAEEFEGTGIGLATVQRILARHGGRIWAEGKVGAGATFFFTLQVAEEK